MNAPSLLETKPLPPLPCDEAMPKAAYINALRTHDIRPKTSSSKRHERMISHKPRRVFHSAKRAMKAYARRRKSVNRHALPTIEEGDEEEEDMCEVCLKSELKTSNLDIFAEPKKLAESLQTLPQVDGPTPNTGKKHRRIPRPRPDMTLLHELSLCAQGHVECEACMPDIKRTWRFAVLDDGDLAEKLDLMLLSEAAGKVWI